MVQEDIETKTRINESKVQNKVLLDLLTENKLENKSQGSILSETREQLKAVRGILSSIEIKNANNPLTDTTRKELSEANQKLKRSEERLRNIYPRVIHEISIKNGKFEPGVINVESGQFLSFTNEDKVTHYIISKDGGFDFHDELLPGGNYTIYVFSGKLSFAVISRDQPGLALHVNILE